MLGSMDVVAFVPSTNMTRSRAFYETVLGLKFVSQDSFALVLDANGTTIRVADVSRVPSYKPALFTILGWHVPDVKRTVESLAKRGVAFERYPGMDQDALGVWTSPSGARVAWFKDPDGNVLSVTQ